MTLNKSKNDRWGRVGINLCKSACLISKYAVLLHSKKKYTKLCLKLYSHKNTKSMGVGAISGLDPSVCLTSRSGHGTLIVAELQTEGSV